MMSNRTIINRFVSIVVGIALCITVLIGVPLIAGHLMDDCPECIQTCQALRPGITLSDMNKKFGAAIKIETDQNGHTWHWFKTSDFASEPIRGIVDKSGKITVLQCDVFVTWRLDPDIKTNL